MKIWIMEVKDKKYEEELAEDIMKILTCYSARYYGARGGRKKKIKVVAGDRIDAFSRMVPKRLLQEEGKRMTEKLKSVIPRQNFAVAIQAAVGAKVIARETISAYRKDVTGGLYGGDFSRKKKLLEKQKRGKKKAKELGQGKVSIPGEAFLAILKN